MDDNKDIEKVSRTAFDNLKMEAPDNAWDKLDAELDKKQAFVYKQRANRFKSLSILLILFIFSFLTWQYIVPSSTTENLTSSIAGEKSANNKTGSDNVTENNDASDIPSENLITAKNNNELKGSDENSNYKLNNSSNSQLAFEGQTGDSKKNIKLVNDESRNNAPNHIDFPTDKNENSTGSDNTTANIISNEPVIVIHDADNTNEMEQNISATNIPDNGWSQLTDTNKSEPAYFIKNDSLLKEGIHAKSRFSLVVFYSPNQSWCNLKDNTDDNFDDVGMYNRRENSEFSYTTGLNLKYDLNTKWSLLSGVSYSTIARSITIETMYADANGDNEMHFQYPTSNGIIEMPYDDTYSNINQGDSMNAKADCNQSIKLINVPLMARFQVTKKKFTGYANGGISVNFVVQEKAKISMNNSETMTINHINGLKKMNYGFLIGAGVQYNMYDDFGIFMEPMFRGSFTSITNNMSVNSYPYSLGLNFGFSLHF